MLGLGAVVYVLLLGEGFVRVFAPAQIMPRYVQATSYGIRGNIPRSHYWHYTPEVSVEYRINSAGIRADREFTLEKPPDTCRVLLFGDSFFMGYEVDLRDAFATQLEDLLHRAGHACEVINLAVSGFGTAEMLRALQANGLKYHPDLIVFQWHRTDPDDNVRANLFALAPDGSLHKRRASYLPSVKIRALLDRIPPYVWIEQHSQLFGALRERAGNLAKRQMARTQLKRVAPGAEAAAPVPRALPTAKELPYPVALSRALLIEANRVATENGAEFMVFEVPSAISRTSFSNVDERLADTLPAEITFASPLESFRRHAGPDVMIYYERGAGHWTPLGNRLAAQTAVERIEADRLLGSHRQDH